jgi:CO dehydrogenase/acetyl-CoA synthase gamma subunit (corrinoid Fe-S protein)
MMNDNMMYNKMDGKRIRETTRNMIRVRREGVRDEGKKDVTFPEILNPCML